MSEIRVFHCNQAIPALKRILGSSRPSSMKRAVADNRKRLHSWALKFIPGATAHNNPLLLLQHLLGIESKYYSAKDKPSYEREQLEELAQAIYPQKYRGEKLAVLLRRDFKLANRPNSLNELFRSEEFSKWFKKLNFRSLADFSKALGVRPIKVKADDPQHSYQHRIDLINLGEAIWPLHSNDEILRSIRKIQSSRPECLEGFFAGDAFRTWMQQHNFTTLYALFDYMDCIKSSPIDQPHRQPHFDYLKIAPEIWPVATDRSLLRSLREAFPQRPMNLATFYPSKEFRAWLKEHNLRAASDLMKAIGVPVKTVEMPSGTKSKFNRHKAATVIWGKEAGQERYQAASAKISS